MRIALRIAAALALAGVFFSASGCFVPMREGGGRGYDDRGRGEEHHDDHHDDHR
jgi:hypothetical protein